MSSRSNENEFQQIVLEEETQMVQAKFCMRYVTKVSSAKAKCPQNGQSSDDIHSELVDGAISQISSNLPAEVVRVSELQRNQTSQIYALQKELHHFERQMKEVTDRSREMKEELEHVVRQSSLLDEECDKKNRQCIKLRNEILHLVKESEARRRELSTKSLEFYAMESKLMEYTRKLDDYCFSMATSDTSTEIQDKIRDVEGRLEQLENKREYMEQQKEETERILNGALETDLKNKIKQINAQSDKLSEEAKQLQEKVDTIRAQQEQVKQATVVLRKRNAAQMIRLKRQVKEQTLRHRQWTEQRQLLQQTVDSLHQKLQG